MLAATRSELFRVYRRRMPRILVGLAGATIAGLYFLLWLSLEGAQDIVTAEGGVDEIREMLSLREVADGGALSLITIVGTIMSVILGASIIATEYNWGTIRLLLPRTSGRAAFLWAKIVTLLLFSVGVSLVGLVGALVASTTITVLAGYDSSLGDGFVLGLARTVGLAALFALPYVALAFMMGLLARSTAAGVGLGLAMLFLEDPLVQLLTAAGGIAEQASEYLLSPNVSVLLELGSSTGPDAGEVVRAFTILAIYTAVFVLMAFWRFQRRDVVAG